jgi:hypothetical protein
MRLAVLALVTTLGCGTPTLRIGCRAMKPGPHVIAREEPILGAVAMVAGTIVIGSAVAAGYFAMGGELPVR